MNMIQRSIQSSSSSISLVFISYTTYVLVHAVKSYHTIGESSKRDIQGTVSLPVATSSATSVSYTEGDPLSHVIASLDSKK